MPELLAPAGNKTCALAAISNGADAIYIGLTYFSARAYAENFTLEDLEEIIKYAHLRNVKVYVTMNTIVYDHEYISAINTIDTIYKLGVDAIIIQDLALIDYINNNYQKLEIHASTQMGIDDLEGIEILEELGVKRVVLAREVNIDKIKELKRKSKMPLEVFIHGALCVSYSGNCLMSGLIGLRSGNRGRCVGCCRKLYQLNNVTSNINYPKAYYFSLKDLNTTNYLKELLLIDSLKIEGRMKEPSYVASVVRSYRELLDNNSSSLNKINTDLTKTFHRTFTKGYIFNEKVENIANTYKPNNWGFCIGKVSGIYNGKVELQLDSILRQNDQIRIENGKIDDEINLPIVTLYDKDDMLINSSDKKAYLKLKEYVTIGSKVYKTKDKEFLDNIEKTYPNEFKRLPISFYLNGEIGDQLTLTTFYEKYFVKITSDEILQKAKNAPLTKDNIYKQLSKLNDTPYELSHLEVSIPENSFIPTSVLNELRRNSITKLNEIRLKLNLDKKATINKEIVIPKQAPCKLAVKVLNNEQYEAAVENNVDIIYYDNVILRNNAVYKESDGPILIGGYGGLKLANNNEIICDYSFNVVNSHTIKKLYELGASRVTLSHELNFTQIDLLMSTLYKEYNYYPYIEMIVYGRQTLFTSKYCPLKKQDLCGTCQNEKYEINDGIASFPLIFKNCTTSVLNSKYLNLIDELDRLKYISVFRLEFTTESKEETSRIIKLYQDKISGKLNSKCFNDKTDTRGHFNREIL